MGGLGIFRGPADYFIPPDEYHIIGNPNSAIAAAIHVYSGQMTEGNMYTPTEDGYSKQTTQLCYS
ncbi:MAG: hypothetical protein HQ519_15155 [Planctomycetes bacterium]|nr:hypothetical protein [Planctomycetota bacterium]